MGTFQSRNDEQSILDIANTYQQAGQEFMKNQCYPQAIYYFEKCLYRLNTDCKKLDERIGRAYYDLGKGFQAQGNTEGALNNYKKSLRAFENGKCNERIPNLYASIAEVLTSNDQDVKALKQCKQGLSEAETRLGMEHSSVGSLCFQIAGLYMKQGDDKKATKFLNRALRIFNIVHGDDSTFAADCFNLMGLIMKKELRYSAAYDLYVRALVIREKRLPRNHIDLATSYSNIGLLFREKRMFPEAFVFLKKCLKIEIERFGLNHQRVTTTLRSLTFISRIIEADLEGSEDEYSGLFQGRKDMKSESTRCFRENVMLEFQENDAAVC